MNRTVGGGNCTTGDCGSNQIEVQWCRGHAPATLAEARLNGDAGMDFCDVSLVDGYVSKFNILTVMKLATKLES